MKRNIVAAVLAVVLAAAVPILSKAKKTSGQILDQQAFRNVHSYCIQTQDLGSHYAQMVQSFFNEQDKPNSMVNQLPWKLVSDCNQADAVMSFKFSETEEPANATNGGNMQVGSAMGIVNVTWFQVTAVVSSRTDSKPIYQVQGARTEERGERALEKTIRDLAKDLKSTQ